MEFGVNCRSSPGPCAGFMRVISDKERRQSQCFDVESSAR